MPTFEENLKFIPFANAEELVQQHIEAALEHCHDCSNCQHDSVVSILFMPYEGYCYAKCSICNRASNMVHGIEYDPELPSILTLAKLARSTREVLEETVNAWNEMNPEIAFC